MRTAVGIITVFVIVVVIYLLLPPATKQAVQFWKPDYSMPPESSASPAASPVANTTQTPNATSIAQITPLPTLRPIVVSTSASPSASLRPTSGGQVASATTALPGTGGIFRDPILLSLSLLATSIAVMTGYRMARYQ